VQTTTFVVVDAMSRLLACDESVVKTTRVSYVCRRMHDAFLIQDSSQYSLPLLN